MNIITVTCHGQIASNVWPIRLIFMFIHTY